MKKIQAHKMTILEKFQPNGKKKMPEKGETNIFNTVQFKKSHINIALINIARLKRHLVS